MQDPLAVPFLTAALNDESLNAIDTNTVPRGGTDIASAIQEAQAALRRRPGTDKILILLTAGEDLEAYFAGLALRSAPAP